MKSSLRPIVLAFSLLPMASFADESKEIIPLNYNPAGQETSALKTIEERKAKFVENEYQDLDQDGIADKLDMCPNSILHVKVDARGCELDSDQDGVFDRLDQCPDSAPGVKVNVFGCEGDEDNDGVFDSKDQCPGTPAGTPVDEVGCKLDNDTDKDGVNNLQDQCPETPAGTTVNEYGCAPTSFVMTNINFAPDEHIIQADQAVILKADAAALEKLQADEVVVITGHTDWQMPQSHNLPLSWRRANSAKEFIIAEFGYPAEVIYIDGKGELEPIASNKTAQGRLQNRRIEFKIMAKPEIPASAKLQMPAEMK